MAPISSQISTDPIATWSPIILPIVVTVVLALSMALATLLCCCCKRDKTKRDDDLYYSIDPSSPNFCPDCAYVAMYGPPPDRRNSDGSVIGYDRGRDYRYRRRIRGEPSTPNINQQRNVGYIDLGGQPEPIAQPQPEAEDSKTRAPEVPSDPSPSPRDSAKKQPQASKAQAFMTRRNPVYKTLFEAKSNVFDVHGGGAAGAKGGGTVAMAETQMRAAQKNPAYRTMWGVQSGVFDKAGAGKNARATQMQGTVTDAGRMKAAQKNPAYRTLWDAKSAVFDKQQQSRAPK